MKKLTRVIMIMAVFILAIAVAPTDNSFAASKIKMSKCNIYLKTTSYTYNGKAKKPGVIVKYAGKKLKKSDNYTVKYSNSKGPGTAKVTITGKGKYSGTVTKSYSIKVGTVSSLKGVYSGGDPADPESNITITWKKPAKCTSYYIKVKKGKENVGTYTTDTNSFTLTDLKEKGTFTFYVYAVAGSNMKSSAKKISVLAGIEKQTISATSSYSKYIGEETFNLNAKASTTLTYTSSNTKVVDVDTSGNVSIKSPGSAVIKINAEASGNYAAASKDIKITIKNLATPKLSVKSPGYRRVDASWNQVTGAQKYTIKETTSSGTVKTYSIDSPTQLQYSLYDKSKGKTYKYAIQASTTVNDKTYTSSWSTTYSVKIVGTVVGEAATGDKGLKGNTPGDQSGNEVRVRAWGYSSSSSSYKHNTIVVRFNDPALAERAASIVEAACANNHIGYDQSNRTTLAKYAKAHGWDTSKITENCDCDCMSLVEVGINGAVKKVIVNGLDARPNKNNISSKISKTKLFTIYTDKKYLTTDAYLQRGDIIFSTTKGHGVMVL